MVREMRNPATARRSVSDGRAQSESGVSLVELLAYMMLSVVILGIIGSILINGLRTEAIVRTANQSTSAGQLALESIQRGVRNSSGFAVSVPENRDQDQVVMVRTAGGAEDIVYTCQAWYYSASERTIRTETSPDGTPVSIENLSTWTLIVEGVAPGASGTVFAQLGSELTIDLTVDAQEREPIIIQSSARSRATSTEQELCA